MASKLRYVGHCSSNSRFADVNFEATPVEALQQVFGWSYPVRGRLAGQFHGRGTRADPAIAGLFDLADGDVYGVLFNRLRGQLSLNAGEVRVADAELRPDDGGEDLNRT